jgi:predicted nucleotidyltransferase
MDFSAAISELDASIPDLIAVYLFGSIARNDSNQESDVDLAVLASGPIDPSLRFELEGRLEEKLRRSVDLIDFRRASAVFRVEILRDATILADVDPRRRAEFECFALSSYARLNEDRAGILEDVRRSGRVHG